MRGIINMVKITNIKSRQVLDSRGNPTVETEIFSGKVNGKGMVPSGASTGIHEALELRDGTSAYGGKGVTLAVANVKKMAKELVGKNFTSPKKFDETLLLLDGTVQKSKFGENAVLSLSMAFRRLLAKKRSKPLYEVLGEEYGSASYSLPMPFANVINGGVHAGNDLEFQEFMVVPKKAKSFASATQIVSEIYHELKSTIQKRYGKNATNVGDEGGFAPPVKDARQALKLLTTAVKSTGYENDVGFAMDAAASEFYNSRSQTYLQNKWSSDRLQKYYEDLVDQFPIISIEDPFDQDDFEAWKSLSKSLRRRKLQIVGDDLTVTDPARVELAIQQKMCDALLLKINQIGSVSESMTAAHAAESDKWNIMVSHRSGETEDPFIADLAVGMNTGQIKLGAPCRSDRVAKYNRLLRIEEELGNKKMSKW